MKKAVRLKLLDTKNPAMNVKWEGNICGVQDWWLNKFWWRQPQVSSHDDHFVCSMCSYKSLITSNMLSQKDQLTRTTTTQVQHQDSDLNSESSQLLVKGIAFYQSYFRNQDTTTNLRCLIGSGSKTGMDSSGSDLLLFGSLMAWLISISQNTDIDQHSVRQDPAKICTKS